MSQWSPALSAVRVVTEDVAGAAELIGAICGSAPQPIDVGDVLVGDGDEVCVVIDEAVVVIGSSRSNGPTGVVGVDVTIADGVKLDGVGVDGVELNGLQLRAASAPLQQFVATPADVVLDHLAIAVHDLEASARRWAQATGAEAELIGLHPISNGTMHAARLALGNQMLELLAPVPDTTSAMASRLANVGEGPMALALPAKDIDAKRSELERLGVQLLWQDPHWFVHPKNPAGVLVQLTPRVKH